MKIAIVPLPTVAKAGGRLDAGFYCDPGGEGRRRATKLRARAAKILQAALDAEIVAVAEEEAASRARGIVVINGKEEK